MIKFANGNFQNYTRFYSKEDANASRRPILNITYITNIAPVLSAKSTSPISVYTDTDISLNVTCSDSDAEDTITAYWQPWLNAGSGYAKDEAEGSMVVSNDTSTEV